ncbi:unnamed protein product [Boreogadus saida]
MTPREVAQPTSKDATRAISCSVEQVHLQSPLDGVHLRQLSCRQTCCTESCPRKTSYCVHGSQNSLSDDGVHTDQTRPLFFPSHKKAAYNNRIRTLYFFQSKR